MMAHQSNWLIIRNGALGDTILLSPLLQQIKQTFPNSTIEILGHPERAALLVHPTQADSVRDYESLPLYTLFAEDDCSEDLKQYFAQFTHIIYFAANPASNNNPLALWERAGVRAAGMRASTPNLVNKIKTNNTQWVNIYPVLPQDPSTHITRHYLAAIAEFVPQPTCLVPKLTADEEAILNAEYDLYRIGIRKPESTIIGIHVGAGSPKKCAPVKHFYEAITIVSNNQPPHLLITQGPADAEAVKQFLIELPEDISYSILLEMPLERLAATLTHCDHFIGNDSGVTHLAAALNLPTTAFFVNSNPQTWRPLNQSEVIILDPTSNDL